MEKQNEPAAKPAEKLVLGKKKETDNVLRDYINNEEIRFYEDGTVGISELAPRDPANMTKKDRAELTRVQHEAHIAHLTTDSPEGTIVQMAVNEEARKIVIDLIFRDPIGSIQWFDFLAEELDFDGSQLVDLFEREPVNGSLENMIAFLNESIKKNLWFHQVSEKLQKMPSTSSKAGNYCYKLLRDLSIGNKDFRVAVKKLIKLALQKDNKKLECTFGFLHKNCTDQIGRSILLNAKRKTLLVKELVKNGSLELKTLASDTEKKGVFDPENRTFFRPIAINIFLLSLEQVNELTTELLKLK